MPGFSVGLQLADLDDFIAPSQECVKPVSLNKKAIQKKTTIEIDDDGGYLQIEQSGSAKRLEKASITLNDCLACSGCITSAESVLITAQSQEELYKVLQHNLDVPPNEKKTVVVSLSPQSIISLAVKYKIGIDQMARKLGTFMRSIGVHYVFDTVFARKLALTEIANEFVSRFKNSKEGVEQLPLLSSACPGWVCYAEKTHGEYILPYISSAKSPQQVMGSLVKDCLANSLNLNSDRMYHVTVMPCYDKKLEASRSDFYDDLYSTRDVDCVLTTGEIEQMLMATHAGIYSFEESPLDSLSVDGKIVPQQSVIPRDAGSGSGGYLEYVMRHAAIDLFSITEPVLTYRVLRNKDFKECQLQDKDGNVLLNCALAYGFRNIQNLVQKIKRNRSPYHFVEVMACPSGCLNGGGQLKAENSIQAKELLGEVIEAFELLPLIDEDKEMIDAFCHHWLGERNTERRIKMLHTQYHTIEKTAGLGIKW